MIRCPLVDLLVEPDCIPCFVTHRSTIFYFGQVTKIDCQTDQKTLLNPNNYDDQTYLQKRKLIVV